MYFLRLQQSSQVIRYSARLDKEAFFNSYGGLFDEYGDY